MKRHVLLSLALGASFLTAGYLLGQNKPAAATAPSAPAGQRLVRMATINGVEANRQFQANVQLVQAQRQAAVELDAALKKEKDAKKKKELQTQLDAVMKKLNENNDGMQKAYGFSLTRNYVMEVETAHIYMLVTEEEAAKIEKAQKAAKK